MTYTNKQINRILHIQDFLGTANILSKIYREYDNKELNASNIIEKQCIYKLFCSAMYNLIDAIKKSNEIFGNTKSYKLFQQNINKKFVADNNEFVERESYESNLYKILAQIRHQNNHFEKDDNDDTMLFEIYIDFEILDDLRKIIDEIFYEVYNEIDKNKIKQITLSRPKIKYSFDKFDKNVDYIELKYLESTNEIDKIFAKDNERAIEILREYCNPSNIFDLVNNDKETLKKYDLNDKEMDELFNKYDKYIFENGNELQKQAMNLIKDFFINNENVTKSEYDKNTKELVDKLKELKEKSEESN
ncbi:unknown [Firmicutes bacterium CAG:321]|nr:unknown [Firmicutes bacterium CAG:321]